MTQILGTENPLDFLKKNVIAYALQNIYESYINENIITSVYRMNNRKISDPIMFYNPEKIQKIYNYIILCKYIRLRKHSPASYENVIAFYPVLRVFKTIYTHNIYPQKNDHGFNRLKKSWINT